jgi:hypothetical protein
MRRSPLNTARRFSTAQEKRPPNLSGRFFLCCYSQAFPDYIAVDWGCMEYPRILTLIDNYLDRLTEARQVLVELESAPVNGQKRRFQATASNRALKAAARERQARLAFDVTPSQPETPRPKAKANKRASPLMAQEDTESQAAVSVQNELFPQEQPHEPPREKQETDGQEGRPLPTIAPAAVSVEARAQRKPSTRNKAANAPAARALGGTVSAAPVFIPAERVRQEHLQKASKKGTQEEASSAATAPLTVEMLTQRWVQGLTF